MTRRYVGGLLFDVLPDGTSTPIVQLVPPRNVLNPILRTPIITQEVIQQFLLDFVGIQVALPGISADIPPIGPVPDVIIQPGAVETPTAAFPDMPLPGTPESPLTIGPGIGVITTRFGIPPQDVEQAIMANWPAYLWQSAAEISHGESGWSNSATNDTRWRSGGQCGGRYFLASAGIWATTEFSIGLFQINICAHGGTEQEWRDPHTNSQKAYQLYAANGDFSAWAYTARALGLPQHVL